MFASQTQIHSPPSTVGNSNSAKRCTFIILHSEGQTSKWIHEEQNTFWNGWLLEVQKWLKWRLIFRPNGLLKELLWAVIGVFPSPLWAFFQTDHGGLRTPAGRSIPQPPSLHHKVHSRQPTETHCQQKFSSGGDEPSLTTHLHWRAYRGSCR